MGAVTKGFVFRHWERGKVESAGVRVRTLRGAELAQRKAELEARDGTKATREAVRQERYRGAKKRGKEGGLQ